MTYEEFAVKLSQVLQPGRQFENPGGGTTTIKSLVHGLDQDNLYYVRGHSTMRVSLRDLHDAYIAFRGKTCQTTDLHSFRPAVFDSKAKGHSCNCTLFFLILREAGLAGEIRGAGVRGNAFRTVIA